MAGGNPATHSLYLSPSVDAPPPPDGRQQPIGKHVNPRRDTTDSCFNKNNTPSWHIEGMDAFVLKTEF